MISVNDKLAHKECIMVAFRCFRSKHNHTFGEFDKDSNLRITLSLCSWQCSEVWPLRFKNPCSLKLFAFTIFVPSDIVQLLLLSLFVCFSVWLNCCAGCSVSQWGAGAVFSHTLCFFVLRYSHSASVFCCSFCCFVAATTVVMLTDMELYGNGPTQVEMISVPDHMVGLGKSELTLYFN